MVADWIYSSCLTSKKITVMLVEKQLCEVQGTWNNKFLFTFVSLIAGVNSLFDARCWKRFYFFLLSRAKLKGNREIFWTQCTSQCLLLNTSASLHLFNNYIIIIINSSCIWKLSWHKKKIQRKMITDLWLNIVFFLFFPPLFLYNPASSNCVYKMLHSNWWIII